MIWLLLMCQMSYQAVTLPYVSVQGSFPTEAVCAAAVEGANSEGQRSVACTVGTDYKAIAKFWRNCVDNYEDMYRADGVGPY